MIEIRVEQAIRLFAPAKINLGLEITGRRDDGYHEIVTVLQAVSLFDVIDVLPADQFSFSGDGHVETDQDLALRAIRLFEKRHDVRLTTDIRIEKRIPIAGGLGGGSSDAGTMLAALAVLAGLELNDAEEVAAELGSDVPFFVRGGASLATGIGTDLTPLESPNRLWLVIITPDVEIPNKTARLYGSLRPSDFSDGESTRNVARAIARGEKLNYRELRNAFSRPLFEIPEIMRARDLALELGAPFVLPCGAGPSLFTLFDRWDEARDFAAILRENGFHAVACTSVVPDLNLGRLPSD